MLLTMMASTGTMWGQTRSEASLVALTFPDDNSANNGLTSNQYTSTWTASIGDYEWSISNFNNNNWTNWTYIKCGRKNNASVATIISSEAYTEPISRVAITIDNITASKINSIKLYTSSNGSNWSASGEFTKATGTQSVALSDPTANLYYKIEFDCASGSSNGLLTVSKVEYFYNEGNPVVVTPIISPDGGPFYETLEVSISCATDGATIYYTTDGNAPTTSSTVYSNPFTIDANTTVNAYAVLENYDDSEVATAEFTKVSPMSVAEAIAAIDATQNLPIASQCVTGIVCTASSNIYSGKLSYWISDDGTANNSLEAYNGFGLYGESFTAVDDVQVGDVVVIYGNLTKYSNTYEFAAGNYLLSLVRPAVTVASPSFSPAAGTYAEAQTVTMSCTTDGAAIHYTTDGTEPDGNSNVYSTGITVSETTTFKAKAIKGDDASNVVTATYHICSADNPYTVAQALEFHAYPTSTIWVHGIVSTAPTAAPNSDGQLTYYISDNGEATNQLQVYKGKGLNNAAFTDQDDIQVGDIVTITGTVKIYNTTTEFDAGNYLTSFERPTPPVVPTITVNTTIVEATATETEGSLTVTYTAIETDLGVEIHWFETSTSTEPLSAAPEWIDADFSTTSIETIDYVIEANTGEARTAYFKVYGLDSETNDVYSELVTINQAAYVPPVQAEDYALFSGTLVEGDYLIVYNGVAMNNTVDSDRLQYEDVTPENNVISTNDATIVWHIAPSATSGYWTIYSANANAYAASTGAKNKAQMLADGTDDKALWSVESTAQSETYDFVNKQNTTNEVNATLRCNGTYGFACYANSTGGALSLYKKAIPSITINPGPYNLNCDGGDAELPVTYTNMPTDPQAEVIFYESNGETPLTENPTWITATINANYNIAGHLDVNTGDARSAYFKVKGIDADNNDVYSDLVTINQAAYVLSIVFETTELDIEVGGEQNRVLSFEYQGFGQNPAFEVRQYDATGQTQTTYEWLTTNITQGHKVNITVDANTGAARSGYFKVYGSDGTVNTESNLVTINQAAVVTYTVSFCVNGILDETLTTQGSTINLPTISTLTPEGFSITGWAASNGSTEAVADPYTPTADITLYAILGQTISHSLVINASTPNFPTSYGTANTFTEYNLAGKNFKIQQGYKNGSILQWRALGNKNGTGTMYNSEDLGKINTIILVYDSSDANKNFTIKAGTTENPTGGTSIEPSINGVVYTFDLSSGDYNYFVMTNGEYAGYLQSISIDYVSDLNINTVTTLNSTQTYSDNIPATTCVIIDNNAVVTFTGTNNGTADNLIIKEGCQLIHESDVAATVQKNITAYTAKDGDGWYLIATPVEPLAASVVAQGTYDLFTYDEEHAYWYSNTGTGAPFTELHRGQGYLYANAADIELNYAGSMKATNANIEMDLSYTGSLNDGVKGFNLVGNPFTRNLKLGDMQLGGANLTTYYVTNTDRTALQAITSDAYQIKPGEGFFVQATAASQQLSFNASSKDDIDFRYIKIVAGNENGYDNAYIQMGDCNTLRKMNIANKTEVYVMDGEDDYAAARVEELAGSMPVHFKAIADGEYTITIEAKYTDVYYMHLFDNFTGEDIDLMLEPSYTFHAAAEDAENRFLLVFDFNNHLGVNENYTNDIFAYQYDDEIIINGEGELQIFDVMGRMVLNTKVNGVQSFNVPSNGVYILRIIGNGIKTQKIVVK